LRLLDNCKDFILVSSGSIIGINIRFIIYNKLEKLNINKNFSILLINILSSFFLGLLLSILTNTNFLDYSYELGLFFSIGLLGSLSTFSTFIYDLYDLVLKLKFYIAFKSYIISLTLGILSFAVGVLLGMK